MKQRPKRQGCSRLNRGTMELESWCDWIGLDGDPSRKVEDAIQDQQSIHFVCIYVWRVYADRGKYMICCFSVVDHLEIEQSVLGPLKMRFSSSMAKQIPHQKEGLLALHYTILLTSDPFFRVDLSRYNFWWHESTRRGRPSPAPNYPPKDNFTRPTWLVHHVACECCHLWRKHSVM